NRSPSLPEIGEPEPAPPPLKAELPDLSEPPEPPPSSPASPQILPPKLSPSASSKPARSLKLPEFPSDLAPQPAEETSAPEPDSSAEESIDFPSDELLEPETEPNAVSPESHQLQTADETFLSTELEDLWAEPEEEDAEEEDAEEELPPEPNQLDRAFQSLHLEDRFWSRMNSLVEDAPLFAAEQPLSEEVDPSPTAEAPPPAEAGEAFETIPAIPEPSAVDVPLEKLFTDSAPIKEPLFVEPIPTPPSSTAAIPLETQPSASDWADDEIVVDDEEEVEFAEPQRDTSGLPYPPAPQPSERSVSPEVPRNPRERLARSRSDSDEPIPTPMLEVMEGELVAGEAAFVRVKLPSGSDSVYVKLWVLDCQTRSLLDGPRALLDLSPNSEGELEATTQMSVPLGSLEIRFEAIAIDIDTQRESHKTSISRAVIPPNLPNTLYNEF
ncbi:MAG: hypothetical protein SVX43_19890, partial [Cyanobacteriota bacterium]|nr:hypothetical protein [Cyanobacteriota bacterium]